MHTKLFSGHIHIYDVAITERGAVVLGESEGIVAQANVDFTSFLATATDIRLGWAEFPDFEVIYIYDKADSNFGYAINLGDPQLSEWGYAPFISEEVTK